MSSFASLSSCPSLSPSLHAQLISHSNFPKQELHLPPCSHCKKQRLSKKPKKAQDTGHISAKVAFSARCDVSYGSAAGYCVIRSENREYIKPGFKKLAEERVFHLGKEDSPRLLDQIPPAGVNKKAVDWFILAAAAVKYFFQSIFLPSRFSFSAFFQLKMSLLKSRHAAQSVTSSQQDG